MFKLNRLRIFTSLNLPINKGRKKGKLNSFIAEILVDSHTECSLTVIGYIARLVHVHKIMEMH